MEKINFEERDVAEKDTKEAREKMYKEALDNSKLKQVMNGETDEAGVD